MEWEKYRKIKTDITLTLLSQVIPFAQKLLYLTSLARSKREEEKRLPYEVERGEGEWLSLALMQSFVCWWQLIFPSTMRNKE